MKKILLLLFTSFLFLFYQKTTAQILQFPVAKNLKNIIRCYTTEVIDAYKKTHPDAETNAQFELWMSKKIAARKAQRAQVVSYTIPVVFHIISKGEAVGTSPNVSQAAIQEQVLQLNKDFANQSNSPYAVAANTGIQFVLAATNAIGATLAEPGIERINSITKGWTDYAAAGWTNTYIDQTVKPASVWNTSNYFNIWVIPNVVSGATDVLGYATFPGSSTLPGLNNSETANTAGVVILTSTIGSAFAPASCGNGYGLGKTLSHESGHFFGLRHIWGDANCGDDFCGDTPVHFTSNSSTPSHPKPNTCGTADEMFENYMDYTDDILLNTFTSNQVDRMQTVMANSPRRISLAASPVTGVPVSATNQISFINCTGSLFVTETATSNAYPRYKDVSLTLNTDYKATGTATVSLTAGGTAVSGLDYQLLTPTVSFAGGDVFKPVIVRVFDNVMVDGDKIITLGYSVTGNGVVAGTSAQSVTITVTDDDNIKVGENTINLINENFENPTGTFGLPAGWGLLRSAGYVNPFVASANGDAGGTGMCAHITNDVNLKPNIYTKGVKGASVLQSPLIDASSVLALGNLSFKYKVRGLAGNDDAYATYAHAEAATGPFYFFGSTSGVNGYGPYSSNTTTIANAPGLAAPPLSNQKFYIDFLWETGTLTTGANPGFNVDDVLFTATPFHIETAVSSSYAYDIIAGTNVNNFKSTSNNAAATISNASENVNAVTVSITQAGTGTAPVTTTGGAFLRTQKVLK